MPNREDNTDVKTEKEHASDQKMPMEAFTWITVVHKSGFSQRKHCGRHDLGKKGGAAHNASDKNECKV